jgi:MFS family permease
MSNSRVQLDVGIEVPDNDEMETPAMTQHDPSAHADRSRWIALYVLCVGVLMIVLDATVNVALPSIQDDVDFSTSSLAWVFNAYLIAAGESQAAALTSGYHLAFWIGAGLVVAAIGVGLAMLRPQAAPAVEPGQAIAEPA